MCLLLYHKIIEEELMDQKSKTRAGEMAEQLLLFQRTKI